MEADDKRPREFSDRPGDHRMPEERSPDLDGKKNSHKDDQSMSNQRREVNQEVW
jgi:hypothetical protein